jgi:hypothetical protein
MSMPSCKRLPSVGFRAFEGGPFCGIGAERLDQFVDEKWQVVEEGRVFEPDGQALDGVHLPLLDEPVLVGFDIARQFHSNSEILRCVSEPGRPTSGAGNSL